MATVTTEVEVSLDDFDDADLIAELEARGYYVGREPEIITIKQHWNRGEQKEALILLEREFPDLYGISRLAD